MRRRANAWWCSLTVPSRLIGAALAIVLVLLLATAGSLLLSRRNDVRAAKQAERAVVLVEAQAAGECFRVNYLRWQDDRARYSEWQKDRTVVRYLRRIPNPLLRPVTKAFDADARRLRLLPQTDCSRALRDPTRYAPPTGVPFDFVSGRLLHRTIDRPPAPPRFAGQPARTASVSPG